MRHGVDVQLVQQAGHVGVGPRVPGNLGNEAAALGNPSTMVWIVALRFGTGREHTLAGLRRMGFHAGDYPHSEDGDTVFARIGEEVDVKRVTPRTVGFEVVGTVVGAVVSTHRDSAQ